MSEFMYLKPSGYMFKFIIQDYSQIIIIFKVMAKF